MRSRRAALLACASLVLPLTGVAVAAPGTAPGQVAKAAEDPTANGTSTGPRRSVASEPGTAVDPGTKLPDLDVIDPATYAYEDAVVESVRVPSRDGVTQIWVDVIRPRT